VSPAVLVSLVTWNAARELPPCLESLRRQTWRDFEVRVWDNASSDGTRTVLERCGEMFADVVLSPVNLGYSAAHNRLLACSATEFALFLNPDTVLAPDFLARAVEALRRHPECGSLSPRLRRLVYEVARGVGPAGLGADSGGPGDREVAPGKAERDGAEGRSIETGQLEKGRAGSESPETGPFEQGQAESLSCGGASVRLTGLLDSTGIVWARNQRHFDRGGGQPDRGQFGRAEYVFGVTGAAAFYRRACLDDVAAGGEVLDEDFFAYREDVDLAWRAAWRGWRCLYAPEVQAWHARKVLPAGRRRYPAAVNRHSVRNRFLLRLKNMPLATWARFCLPITARDLGILLYLPFGEPSSLPALAEVVQLLPRFLGKRRRVLGTAKVPRRQLERWFTAASLPLE